MNKDLQQVFHQQGSLQVPLICAWLWFPAPRGNCDAHSTINIKSMTLLLGAYIIKLGSHILTVPSSHSKKQVSHNN